MYLIKQVSQLSGVSVRTLHYYDDIGLLSPAKDDNGYRLYSEEDLTRLQLILFYRYLGFPLKKIQRLLESGDKDILTHLNDQLTLMLAKKEKLETLIETLQTTIDSKERKMMMPAAEKFKGFTYDTHLKYQEEAKEKYGEKANMKVKNGGKLMIDELNIIFTQFAKLHESGLSIKDSATQELTQSLHQAICQYAFDCSKDVLSKIGQAYVENPAFKENIDQFKEGTAQYVCDAIQVYVKE